VIDLKKIPSTPGVYIYKDKTGKIIYVGKAINLKKRVTQYFQRDDALGPKTKSLVSKIHSIQTKTVDSELQALVLEASLIKKHLPHYNSLLKDDRSYTYIVITKDKLPLVYSTHQSNLPEKAFSYGPFPDASAVKSLLKTLRRIFPYYSKKHHPTRKCLYCHLKLCPGPSPDPKDYKKTISYIKKILSGKFSLLQRQLKKEMQSASKVQAYESALIAKKQLDSLNYVVSGWKNLNLLFQSVNLPQDLQSSALHELYSVLKPYLPQLQTLNRLECFDISQLGHKHFVGSMSVSLNASLRTDQYRQFKIRSKQIPDDQYMIQEVVQRRLKHPEWGQPQLIIVDGGKPQVSAATNINTNIPIIGLAKREETIVIKIGYSWQEIKLPKNSNALRLLQLLRDEAHRFANKYRKKLQKIK